ACVQVSAFIVVGSRGGPLRAAGKGGTGLTVLAGWGGAPNGGAGRTRDDTTIEQPPAVGLGLAALHAHEFGAGRLATLRGDVEAHLDAHLDRNGQEQPDPLGRNVPDLRGPVSKAADTGRAAEGGAVHRLANAGAAAAGRAAFPFGPEGSHFFL